MSVDEPIGDDFARASRLRWLFSIRSLMLSVLAVAMLLALFQIMPAFQPRCRYNRRLHCASNFRQVGLALLAYHRAYGCLPPAYAADAAGKPMHSWRTLVLPFLDAQDLFNECKFDEPWDSPNNRGLADVRIGIYRCPQWPDARPGLTDYVVIRGPGTAFPGGGKRVTLADVRDDPATTVLAVEMVDSGIRWPEPRDLDIGSTSFRINDPTRAGISGLHPGGGNVLMMDGSVRFLRDDLSPAIVRALITIDGGEVIDKDVLGW